MKAFKVTFWNGGEFCGESQSDSWERIFRCAADWIYDPETDPLIAEISRNHSQKNSSENGELLNLERTQRGGLQAFRYFSGRRGKAVVAGGYYDARNYLKQLVEANLDA